MAYDESFAERIRDAITGQPGLDEKKMFGGIGYLINGNMACGIWKDSLVIRVGPDNYDDALAQPHTSLFDVTGREMKGWILVGPEGIAEDDDLAAWAQKGVDFALSLPPK